MAPLITKGFIECIVCETSCSNEVILASSSIYMNNSARRTECVDFHAKSQSVDACRSTASSPIPRIRKANMN